ncbi:hypothetical protein [Mesorhizobium australicum]|uniref:hypothetical protein n=1 Tax=Mesorhizobium australicum TaxID=536018 RepID=UPI00333AD0CF
MIKNYGLINDRSPHIIADLFEIIAFFENKEVSRGDIETYLQRDGGKGLEDAVEDDAGGGSATSAELNEQFQRLSEEVFSHLIYRQAAFGEWYPFAADRDVLTLAPVLSDKMKIYVSLLAYSRLKMFSNRNRSLFAANFEKLSVEAVKGLFAGWDVLHFGKGGGDRGLFGSKLKEAIRELAKRMKDTTDETHISALSEQDTGDAGIDIVAMHDFGDTAPGITAFFGQCAAQQLAWPEKRFESHPISLRKYMHAFHPPGTLLIIPVLYRNPDGNWVDTESYPTVLLDRLRIVQLLESRNSLDAISAALATVPAGLIPEGAAAA